MGTAYIDVDLTMIDHDDNLYPGVAKGLRHLKEKGYRLICWSGGGMEYARRMCEKQKIEGFFDYFLDKPAMIIDDAYETITLPATKLKPSFWKNFIDKIE